MTEQSIHQFTLNNIEGQPISLQQYEGKVLLIVNTASKCGFTPQLEDMTELYQEFKDQNFEILAFPSNDFNGQEPLDGEAIQQFCVLNYQAAYPIFEKVHVKGDDTCELYDFLADRKRNGNVSMKPKWNFHKYLIDKNGLVVDYFLPITSPTAGRVKRAIRNLL